MNIVSVVTGVCAFVLMAFALHLSPGKFEGVVIIMAWAMFSAIWLKD